MPAANFTDYARRVALASRRADAAPSEAQREAQNHRVGSVHLHGFQISVTNPKGSVRKGKSKNGDSWSKLMSAHYGYIRRTSSHDGEQLDVYVGPHPESQLVYVIDQLDEDGNFDEYKCVMGARNHQEARKIYLAHYPEGWEKKHLGEVRGFMSDQFRKWLKQEKLLKKSAGETKEAALPPSEDKPGKDKDHKKISGDSWANLIKLSSDWGPAVGASAAGAAGGAIKPTQPPAAPVPPKAPAVPAKNKSWPVSKGMYVYPGAEGSDLAQYNAQTNPSRSIGQSTAQGSQYESEKRLADETLSKLPQKGLSDFISHVHRDNTRMPIVQAATAPSGPSNRPLITKDEMETDPAAWNLYRQWAAGREHPIDSADEDRGARAARVTDSSGKVKDLTRVNVTPDRWPVGLTARHEVSHAAQDLPGQKSPYESLSGGVGELSASEMVPSLADTPFLEQWVRDRQKLLGRPVTGSGVSVPLGMRNPPAGGYENVPAETLRRQAEEHGVFDGANAADLLNTNAGRAWLKQRMTTPPAAPAVKGGSATLGRWSGLVKLSQGWNQPKMPRKPAWGMMDPPGSPKLPGVGTPSARPPAPAGALSAGALPGGDDKTPWSPDTAQMLESSRGALWEDAAKDIAQEQTGAGYAKPFSTNPLAHTWTPTAPGAASQPKIGPSWVTHGQGADPPAGTLPGSDLGLVNAQTNPSGVPGRSTVQGYNYAHERQLADKTLAQFPSAGIVKLTDHLHTAGPMTPIVYGPNTWQREGERPLITGGEMATDPVAWDLHRRWAQGRTHPVQSVNVPNGPGGRSGWAQSPQDDKHLTGIDIPTTGSGWTSGFVARHELDHGAQTFPGAPYTYRALDKRTGAMIPTEDRPKVHSGAELTPSLTDVPMLEQWVRGRQKYLGRPVTGSGANIELGVYNPGAGTSSDYESVPAETIRQQAQEHGIFEGQSMARLLNSNAGQAWLKQRMPPPTPEGALQDIVRQLPVQFGDK